MFGQRKKKHEKPVGVDLNRIITPFLDVSFQLLFYFVLQFKPVIEEGQIDLSLPSQDAATSSPVFQENLDNEKPDEYTIHVNSVLVQGSDRPIIDDRDGILYIWYQSKVETVAFPQENLIGALRDKLNSIPKWVDKDKKKPPTIKLQINNKLKYENVMALMDLCRETMKEKNIKDIGLMGYPKDKGGGAPIMP